MSRNLFNCAAMLALAATLGAAAWAGGQMPGQGGMGGAGGMGRPGMSQPQEEMGSSTVSEKPDAAAKKAYTAAMKSLNKAREFESAAAAATNPDKRSTDHEKMEDAYNRALDQFTEALSNKGDMYQAWNNVGYIHLRLGAYAEALDDYNHTLALKADLLEAVEGRGEARMAVDRLEDAKADYMDLFNHDRPLADRLMGVMQKWVADHRANPNGMRASDVDAFDKWVQERDAIARQAPAPGP